MSILERIKQRRANKKAAAEQVAEIQSPVEQPQTPTEPASVQEVVPAIEQSQQLPHDPTLDAPAVVGKPLENKDGSLAATSELDPVSDHDGATRPVDAAVTPDEDKIETIPLGKDEIKSLNAHHYDANKDGFPHTYVIEKMFWGHIRSSDPTNPGHRLVRVKRVAEIRAVNVVHALNMLGWDNRNIEVVSVKDEYSGEMGILVDGKLLGTFTIPADLNSDVPFEYLGGRMRNDYINKIAAIAMSNEGVVKHLANKKRIVVGKTYAHRDHINLKTVKAPKQVAVEATSVPVVSGDNIQVNKETTTQEETIVQTVQEDKTGSVDVAVEQAPVVVEGDSTCPVM